MLWRCKWKLLYTSQKTQILNILSVCTISSSPFVCFAASNRTHNLISREKPKRIITPVIVHSTLLSCPSDLISLSFFIWCAKEHNYFHNNQAFDHMVSVLTRLTDRHKTVKAIVVELEAVGLIVRAQTFLLLLRIYWRGRMHSMVLETFEQMSSFGFTPNTFAHNVVMDVLFNIGRVDVGIKVLKEAHLPNFLSFSIALCNLCKLNDFDNIKDVICIMLRKGYYPNVETFEMLLNCLCKVGRLRGAYQVLGLMITLGISLSVNAWTILIDGFCRLHQPNMAYCLLEKMVESGCSPNVVTYTSLFKGFIESRMITSAFSILNAMRSQGYAPDLVLCNVLMHTLYKIGRYDAALDVFIGLSKRKLVPDSYTFSSLLSTICSSGRFNLLPKLVSGLVIKADLAVYNSLLTYHCKARSPLRAVKLYDHMMDRGFTPDNYSFVGLLRALCAARKTDEAVNVYNGLAKNYPSLDAHVHTVIMDGLIKSGRWHKAIRLFRRAVVEKYPLDAISYMIAIRALIKGKRTAEALTVFNWMKEVGFSPDARTYSVMLFGLSMERDVKMFKKLLQEIIDLRVQLDNQTLIRITHFLLKSQLSSSSLNQLIELRNLGLMSDESIHAMSLDGLAHGVNIDDMRHSLPNGNMENNMFMDSYSSDDLSDVAASVG